RGKLMISASHRSRNAKTLNSLGLGEVGPYCTRPTIVGRPLSSLNPDFLTAPQQGPARARAMNPIVHAAAASDLQGDREITQRHIGPGEDGFQGPLEVAAHPHDGGF